MDKLEQNNILNYKFSQIFGFKGTHQKVVQDDIITALKFDSLGKYIALGDKAGRIIVFENDQTKKNGRPYEYLTEFQSHTKEFDALRSLELNQGIVGIQWLQPQGKYLKMVTASQQKIKLWKIFEKAQKKVIKSSGKDLSLPKLSNPSIDFVGEAQKIFPNKHLSPINTLNKSHNQQYLLVSDESQILLWSFQKPEKPYILVDFLSKGSKGEQVGQITCSKYHPSSDSLFVYGSDKGALQMADLRESSSYETSCIEFGTPPLKKNYLYELISRTSSVDFMKAGKYVISRDLLTVKLWDVCSPKKPLNTYTLNDSYKSKLCQMAENDSIYESFSIGHCADSRHVLTGSFNNCFHVVDVEDGRNAQYELSYKKSTLVKEVGRGLQLGKVDYRRKVQVTDFHPRCGTLAVASANCFFTYCI